jgi:hypothetical protein
MSVNTPDLRKRIADRYAHVEKLKSTLDESGIDMSSEPSIDVLKSAQDKIERWARDAKSIVNQVSVEDTEILNDFFKLAVEMDEVASMVADAAKKLPFYKRLKNGLKTTSEFSAAGLYWEKTEKKKFDEAVQAEMNTIKQKWDEDVKRTFEADKNATAGAKAGIEGRRWAVPYTWTPAEADELRRKKEAFDKVQAVVTVHGRQNTLQGNLNKAGVSLGYAVKSILGTSISTVEEGVVSTGQALMVGLGGPGFAALMVGWRALIELPIFAFGTIAARALGTVDGFIGVGMDAAVERFNDPKASTVAKVASAGAVALTGLLRAPFYIGKAVGSGVAGAFRALDVAAGKFMKKNVVPLLGVAGTAVGAYFIAITVASAFTLGIPLALTLVGLACAGIGAGIATWMKGKAKASEYINMRLPPDEEAILKRYDYQEKQKPNKTLEAEVPNVQIATIPHSAPAVSQDSGHKIHSDMQARVASIHEDVRQIAVDKQTAPASTVTPMIISRSAGGSQREEEGSDNKEELDKVSRKTPAGP